MNILGLSGVFGHDPAACILIDGIVMAAAEEERFTRTKHGFGQVPVNATLFCLGQAAISIGDVDLIAASWNPGLAVDNTVLRDYLSWMFDRLGVFWGQKLPPIEYVDHHLAHAASAFFSSGLAEAALIVVDGQGEATSTSIGFGSGRKISLDLRIGIPHSLGQFYRSASQYAGFPGFSEGKFMGLAAYGRRVEVPRIPFDLTQEGYEANQNELGPNGDWLPWLSKFGKPVHPEFSWNVADGRQDRSHTLPGWCADLAASAQQILEEVELHLVRVALDRYGTRSLALSGGVALNCSANGAIWRSELLDRLYVMPAAHDAGAAIGAAMWAGSHSGPVSPLPGVDLGPRFSTGTVADTLRRLHIAFEEPVDPPGRVADLLIRGKTIGWFHGGMEIGPRALGNRSILAMAGQRSVGEHVNRLKGREPWRPFAPSMLAAEADRLLVASGPYQHMIVATSASSIGQQEIPAAVHVDGTVRPQTVPEGSGSYANLLLELKHRTGTGAVLNTSFNLDHEPIVCTPKDALRTFYSSELDVLAIEGLLIEKGGCNGAQT